MAAYKKAAVKVTPPNDFSLGLIRSHMVVIHLFLMLCDLQRVVRDLCTILYFSLAKGVSISPTVFSVTDLFQIRKYTKVYAFALNLPAASGPEPEKWIWHLWCSREWCGYPASRDRLAPSTRRIKWWSAASADFVFPDSIQKWIWKCWLESSLCFPLYGWEFLLHCQLFIQSLYRNSSLVE